MYHICAEMLDTDTKQRCCKRIAVSEIGKGEVVERLYICKKELKTDESSSDTCQLKTHGEQVTVIGCFCIRAYRKKTCFRALSKLFEKGLCASCRSEYEKLRANGVQV